MASIQARSRLYLDTSQPWLAVRFWPAKFCLLPLHFECLFGPQFGSVFVASLQCSAPSFPPSLSCQRFCFHFQRGCPQKAHLPRASFDHLFPCAQVISLGDLKAIADQNTLPISKSHVAILYLQGFRVKEGLSCMFSTV